MQSHEEHSPTSCHQEDAAARLPPTSASADSLPIAANGLRSPAAVLALQRSAGNQAVARMLAPRAPCGVARDEAFAVATSGTSAEVPRRREMEAAFGTGFGDVRAHLGGGAAQAGLGALGARAATRGTQVAFRDESPSDDLVAHELAHVVQQRRGVSGVARSADGGGAGSPAERAAEQAAAAVAAGRPVPDPGTARAGDVQLAAVTTSGGEWDTTTYTAVSGGAAAGAVIGADIDLKFTPKDPVVADHIGLTQTVKTLRSTSAGGAVDDPSFVGARNTALSLGAGKSDPGRAIDQGDPGGAGDTLPNTSPFYAVENSPGKVSASLGDVAPTAVFGSHASRKPKPTGGFEELPGNLVDTPRRQLAFAGQEWEHSFETTALAIDGPLANMYLGSIAWGWRCDAAGKVSLDPKPIRVVREGAPTAAFMDAARLWNAATFTDPSDAANYGTVDLPIEGVDPGSLTTVDLGTRLTAARTAAAGLAGAARTRKDFEALGLERELKKRNVKVAVKVIATEDWTGADNVYVKLSGGATHKTPVKKLNDGQSHDFMVSLATFPTLPVVDPVKVEVFDEDTPDADDLIVTLAWAAPFARATNTSSLDDANYEVTVSYDR